MPTSSSSRNVQEVGQNAPLPAQRVHERPTWRTWVARIVGSWALTPIVLAATLTGVFFSFGKNLERRESRELHQVFEANLALVARILEVASEHAIRDDQDRDLQKVISSVAQYDEDLDVLVVNTDGSLRFASRPDMEMRPEVAALAAATFAQGSSLRATAGEGLERVALLTAMLDPSDGPHAALVIVKPMRALDLDLIQTRRHARQTAFFLAIFTLLFGLIVSHLRVHAPLRQLRDIMDSLRDVDGVAALQPSNALTLRGENEVRAVSAAFSGLLARLAQARASVEALHQQREALTHRLADSGGRARLLQYSAEIAHEIGSPLQVILGRATLLLARADKPEDVRRNAGLILDETQRIQRIVESSLSSHSLASGTMQPLNLRAHVDAIVELVRGTSHAHAIDLRSSGVDPALSVHMDGDALDQILRNLLMNAVEASTAGGLVTVSARHTVDGVELRIADNGRGMSPDEREEALRPFVTSRAHGAGHGLGLPIVQRLCRDFGVGFAITSERGAGTCVTLSFRDAHPLTRGEEYVPHAAPERRSDSGR